MKNEPNLKSFHEFLIQVQIIFSFKTDVMYREVFSTPVLNYCEVAQFSSKNFLVKQLYDSFKKGSSKLIQLCPYKKGVSTEINFIYV